VLAAVQSRACPPRFAEAAAGDRGVFGDLEAMPVQEAGKPAGAGEDLAVDPGVAGMLAQFACCRSGAEELAETVVFQGADAQVQPGGRRVRGSSGVPCQVNVLKFETLFCEPLPR
jgi:hypothetical protein